MSITPAFALFLLFCGLKLGGVIAWSWWWVTSPLWLGVALWIVAVVCMFGLAVFFSMIASFFRSL